MLKRFSIVLDSGIEIFSWPEGVEISRKDPLIVAGFLKAMQCFGDEIDKPIDIMRMGGDWLYTKNYGTYSFQILSQDQIAEYLLDRYFAELYQIIHPIILDAYDIYIKPPTEAIHEAARYYLANLISETRLIKADTDHFDLTVNERRQLLEFNVLKRKLENQDKYGRLQ